VAGQTITYTLTATNTGDVTLSNVSIGEDSFTGSGTAPVVGSCSPVAPGTLAPSAQMVCTASYVVTQADVDAGSVANTATATGTDPNNTTVTSTDGVTVSAVQTASFSNVKSSTVTDVNNDGLTDAGDTIAYAVTVTNTGNTTLSSVTASDPMLAGVGISLVCSPTTLAPGASSTCTADGPYVITQADVDAGGVANTATVTVTPPPGVPVTPPAPPSNFVPTDAAPGISLVKTADKTQLVAGQTITYTLTATNTGDVTLSNVSIGEGSFTGSGTAPVVGSCSPAAPGTLAPSAQMVCTASYVVTQADVDAGSVANTATATGTDPNNTTVTSTDSVSVPEVAGGSLALDKRVASVTDVNSDGKTDLGDEINFEFLVTNTGNVTMSAVSVNDPMVGLVICNSTTLAPGASVLCTAHAPYVITQADVDAGVVHNVATASGKKPDGSEVTSPSDETRTPLERHAAQTLDKRVASITDVDGDGRTDAGDKIVYEFDVTNTGNVTLNQVSVGDPKLAAAGITVTCEPTTLAPGKSVTCTASAPYVVTEADVAAGQVHNVATAHADGPSGVDRPAGSTDTADRSTKTARTHGGSSGDDLTSLANSGAPANLMWLFGGGALLMLLALVLLIADRSGSRSQDGRRRA
jgi:uncharacterized repeat protein (TIGR01451 family)